MKRTLIALAALCTISAAHADNISIDANNGQYYLGECGGTIEAKVSKSGDLNLVLRDVKKCSNFDIIGDDGYALSQDYKAKKIPVKGDCDERATNCARSGSFTVPASLHDSDWLEELLTGSTTNLVTVIVKSNSGKTSDTVKIYYEAE